MSDNEIKHTPSAGDIIFYNWSAGQKYVELHCMTNMGQKPEYFLKLQREKGSHAILSNFYEGYRYALTLSLKQQRQVLIVLGKINSRLYIVLAGDGSCWFLSLPKKKRKLFHKNTGMWHYYGKG
jgi:hypothetical protein